MPDRPVVALLLTSVALLLTAPSAGRAAARQRPPPDAPDLAISHVDVIDVRQGRVLRDRTVVIADGDIQRVAPASVGDAPSAACT